MKALVIDGPNINLLGLREPAVYGTQDYQALLDLIARTGVELGFERVDHFQSNHEGDLVDAIQQAWGVYDGIVINPAAYTHTSVAVLDALKAVGLPAVEVHISDVSSREDFRQVSYARLACFATITGEGIAGYAHALRLLADRLQSRDAAAPCAVE